MTDRIEAIHERLSLANGIQLDEVVARHYREDVPWLLAEVERLQVSVDDFNEEIVNCEVLKYKAQVQRVTALATNWERLAATAMDPDVREWCTAAAKSVRDALTPVAPDAEPTEWEWSPGDVVLDADGIAWQRDSERIYYPWRAVGLPVQRDQDITDLVTKHGGRVLVCKARGIGVGGAR